MLLIPSDTCTTAAPGQKECDSALREIQAAATLLDTPNEPVNDNSYFQCLDTVVDKSKILGQSMTGENGCSVIGSKQVLCNCMFMLNWITYVRVCYGKAGCCP